MTARSPHESHRTATPLELLFDLVFVVAIAQAASGLHHAITAAHALEGLIGYLMVFFAIWWAWMNFTWFASAYDCDDVLYRLAVFVQIAGALIMAGGVTAMFETRAPNLATIGGYVVMRLALVAQWLRAAASDPARRKTGHRYAAGITVLQLAWIAVLFVPGIWIPAFLTLAALELALPVWAEGVAPTTWHPHHIAERYGLLTLIVLGESILAATIAVQSALSSGEALSALVPLIIGGLLIVYSMWWMSLRSSGPRSAHQPAQSHRLGLWSLPRLCFRGSGRCRAGGLRRLRDSSRQDSECWRRSGRRCSGCGFPDVSLVSPRSPRVWQDARHGSHRCGAHTADAVQRPRCAAHGNRPYSAGGGQARRDGKSSVTECLSVLERYLYFP